MSVRSTAAVVVLVLACALLPAQAGRLYWSQDQCVFDGAAVDLQSAGLDGSDPQLELSTAGAGSVALDTTANRAYMDWWVPIPPGPFSATQKLLRVSASGCSLVADVPFQGGWFNFVELDPGAGMVYWIAGSVQVFRAGVDTTNQQQLLAGGLSDGRGLALDPGQGKMYYSDDSGIRRANLDGSGQTMLLSGEQALDLAVDSAAGKLYWLTETALRRANLDGSAVEDLLALSFPTSYGPFSLELDVLHGKVYWTENGVECNDEDSRILRADLDGGNPEVVLDGLSKVWDIALDPAGDGIGPLVCEPVAVPAVGRGATAVLCLLSLSVLSIEVNRRRRRRSA